MVNNLKLVTKNLIIRSYKADDYIGLFDTLNDQNVLAFIPESSITKNEAQEAVNWLISNYKRESNYKYSFPIESQINHDFMGWCGFGYLDFDIGKTEIYITLKSKYWGQGYATEALEILLKYIFNDMNLNEIVAVVKPDNIASRRVIEKLDFKYETVISNMPEKFKFYEGELFYTMLKQDRKMAAGVI